MIYINDFLVLHCIVLKDIETTNSTLVVLLSIHLLVAKYTFGPPSNN